jgi:hypothetical protein
MPMGGILGENPAWECQITSMAVVRGSNFIPSSGALFGAPRQR